MRFMGLGSGRGERGLRAAGDFACVAESERPFLAALAARPARGLFEGGLGALFGASFAAYAAAFVAAVLFSAKGIFAKKAYEAGATPESLLALRFLMAAPVFAGVALLSGGTRLGALSRRDWFLIALVAGGGVLVSSLLDFHGLRYISVGLERMILYTYPAMVMLISAWFARRAPGRAALAALALSYAGLAVAFFGEARFAGGRALVVGSVLVLSSALVYALFLVGSDRLGKRIGAQRLMALGMLACTAMFLPLALAEEGSALWHQRPAAYGWAALMAALGTIVPVLLTAYAIKRLGATRMSIVGTAGAVAVLPLAALILGEHAGLAQWLGFGLTVVGGVVLAKKK